jgi:site-specific DNA recombinase
MTSTTTPTPTYFFVYARASKDPQLKKVSVDRQVEQGIAYGRKKWPKSKHKVFRDDGITAADPDVFRPGFAEFITAVRASSKGELVGVVASEQARLTREGTAGWEALIVTLTAAGLVEVDTWLGGVVSIAEGNRMVGRIMSVIDQEYVERVKVKVRGTHSDLFDQGRPSGRAPFGYVTTRDDDGRPALAQHPDQVAVVAQVFEWALDGVAMKVIADKLNADGVPSRSAGWQWKDGRTTGQWKSGTVRSLLTSPTVAGMRAHTDAEGHLHTRPAKWEPIIDIDTWQQVQRLLGQPRTVIGHDGEPYRVRTQPAAQPRRHLLSGGRRQGVSYGVLRCGKCGQPLGAQTQGRRDGARVAGYQCHPKIGGDDACGGVSISPADEVEAFVVGAMQARLVASAKLRKRLSATADAEVARWRKERDDAKAVMLDASALFGSRAIDRDSFDAMHGPAKRDHDHAEAQLAAMSSDTVLPSVDDVLHRWDGLTLKQQRSVVERLVDRIVIAPGSSGRAGLNTDRIGKPVWLA